MFMTGCRGEDKGMPSSAGTGVLETVTSPATLDEIGTTLDRMWSAHSRVPASVRTQVSIAVGEIAATILEHAGTNRPVRVSFLDDGPPAEVNLDSPKMPDHMAERGRGLAIAHAVLERLHYRRSFVNHWTLVSRSFA